MHYFRDKTKKKQGIARLQAATPDGLTVVIAEPECWGWDESGVSSDILNESIAYWIYIGRNFSEAITCNAIKMPVYIIEAGNHENGY